MEDDTTYTVVFFPVDDRSIVFSGTAAHAIERVKRSTQPAGPLMVVGGGFTAEARAILEAERATILAISNFHWTDASFQEIRQRLYRK